MVQLSAMIIFIVLYLVIEAGKIWELHSIHRIFKRASRMSAWRGEPRADTHPMQSGQVQIVAAESANAIRSGGQVKHVAWLDPHHEMLARYLDAGFHAIVAGDKKRIIEGNKQSG